MALEPATTRSSQELHQLVLNLPLIQLKSPTENGSHHWFVSKCWAQTSLQTTFRSSMHRLIKPANTFWFLQHRIFLPWCGPPSTPSFYLTRQRNSLNKAMFLHLLQEVCLPCIVCKQLYRFPLTFVISPPLHNALCVLVFSITRESKHLLFI